MLDHVAGDYLEYTVSGRKVLQGVELTGKRYRQIIMIHMVVALGICMPSGENFSATNYQMYGGKSPPVQSPRPP